MKLDVNMLRYLARDDWRVLTSVEMGEKNVSLRDEDTMESDYSPRCMFSWSCCRQTSMAGLSRPAALQAFPCIHLRLASLPFPLMTTPFLPQHEIFPLPHTLSPKA